ncbi:hypothetical protein [Nostoc sp. MG11]|nr:hypothetical protein [Nostoc sp. MG11]
MFFLKVRHRTARRRHRSINNLKVSLSAKLRSLLLTGGEYYVSVALAM